MININRQGSRFDLYTAQVKKYKSVKIFIWVKASKEVKTTKQEFRIYNIKSQKPASLKFVRKVKCSKIGYWLEIESRRLKKFLNKLLSSSTDHNIIIGMLANPNIFRVTVKGDSYLKVN